MSSVVRGRGSLTPTVAGGSVRGLPGSDCGCGVSIWAVAGVSGEQQQGGGPWGLPALHRDRVPAARHPQHFTAA